jgi:hypothetical protein
MGCLHSWHQVQLVGAFMGLAGGMAVHLPEQQHGADLMVGGRSFQGNHVVRRAAQCIREMHDCLVLTVIQGRRLWQSRPSN